MTRTTRTPADRALEALAVARRKADRLTSARAHQADLLARTDTELAKVWRRLGYLEDNPDLPRDSDGNPDGWDYYRAADAEPVKDDDADAEPSVGEGAEPAPGVVRA